MVSSLRGSSAWPRGDPEEEGIGVGDGRLSPGPPRRVGPGGPPSEKDAPSIVSLTAFKLPEDEQLAMAAAARKTRPARALSPRKPNGEAWETDRSCHRAEERKKRGGAGKRRPSQWRHAPF